MTEDFKLNIRKQFTDFKKNFIKSHDDAEWEFAAKYGMKYKIEFDDLKQMIISNSQSEKSKIGNQFTQIVFNELVSMSDKHPDDEITFDREVSYGAISKDIPRDKKRRRADIIAYKDDMKICISGKGGCNSTTNEDDILKQYVNGYILITHNKFKKNINDVQYTMDTDGANDTSLDIDNLYEAIKTMFLDINPYNILSDIKNKKKN